MVHSKYNIHTLEEHLFTQCTCKYTVYVAYSVLLYSWKYAIWNIAMNWTDWYAAPLWSEVLLLRRAALKEQYYDSTVDPREKLLCGSERWRLFAQKTQGIYSLRISVEVYWKLVWVEEAVKNIKNIAKRPTDTAVICDGGTLLAAKVKTSMLKEIIVT